MVRKPRAFFCYPSEPSLRRDTLTRAANLISGTGLVEGITWEGLYVTGRVLIDEITRAIGEAEVSVSTLPGRIKTSCSSWASQLARTARFGCCLTRLMRRQSGPGKLSEL
jgi:hypothetical protein